jgi:aspartyl-tRNA(Asn)/glutamyl-tRNA(Gln) amidotransferase subunit A
VSPVTGTAIDIARVVASGRRAAHEPVRGALDRIARQDGRARLNAFLASDEAAALRAAADVAATVAAGRTGPLAGVPVGVKDNICTPGLPTTCGSRLLDGFVPPYEATALHRLRAAGAIVAGKTNLDEFGMGSSTENSAFGATLNPLDPGRVPGGSSGGSAAAVAAGIVPVALGSETGGSVRQPAAFCGVVGLKPSYGRVSRYGLVAFASSLDQIGVFARNVVDAALVLECMAGHDPLDATTARLPVPRLAAAAGSPRADLVVGVPDEYFPDELDPRVRARCAAALERWRAAGATIRRVSLPHTRYAIPTYYVIATAEASSNLARYDAVRYGPRHGDAVYAAARSAGFGAEVKRRIVLGTFVLSAGYHDAYYGRAQRVRARIVEDFDRVFADGIDVLFTPTTPTPAFRLGEKLGDPYEMYLSDVFTVTANLAAVPAVSLPIGSVDGLPVGGQLIAARWREDTLLSAAASLEAVARA